MVSVRVKLIDDGLTSDSDLLKERLAAHLKADDIRIDDDSDITLKIKTMIDNDQEVVLLQLRETASKVKLGEKVIHFIQPHWIEDTIHEAHALVASMRHEQA